MKTKFLIILLSVVSLSAFAQTQTEDLNMGLYRLNFTSASGGYNRIQSYGGTYPGTWLFKSRFDDIYIDAGENENNRFRIFFLTGGIERLRINNNGFIGIGTANPRGIFDITSSGDKYLTSSTESVGTAEDLFLPGHIYFTPTTNGNQVFVQARRQSNSGSSKFNFRTYNNGVLNDAALFIDANANVGIGINSPVYKLTVGGVISATEVKVSTTPNSDYVFEPDYNLKSLQEVDSFIQQNKHLPDIPSAEEFKENGIGLGEMDDMLLRKIEELTLYVIELKKSDDTKTRIIEELQREIKSLKKVE